jgi:hypothetical protein
MTWARGGVGEIDADLAGNGWRPARVATVEEKVEYILEDLENIL